MATSTQPTGDSVMSEAGRESPASEASVQGPSRVASEGAAPSNVMGGPHSGSPHGSRGSGRATAPPVMPGYGDASVDTTRDITRDGTAPVASVMGGTEAAHNVMNPARYGAVVDVAAPHHRDSDERSARQARVSSAVSRAESRYSSRSHTVGTTAPGTQFSRVQHLWRKRESGRRTSPSRSLSRQTLMLQESLTNV